MRGEWEGKRAIKIAHEGEDGACDVPVAVLTLRKKNIE